MDASLVLEELFGRSMALLIIERLNSRLLWSSFGWSTKKKFFRSSSVRYQAFSESSA